MRWFRRIMRVLLALAVYATVISAFEAQRGGGYLHLGLLAAFLMMFLWVISELACLRDEMRRALILHNQMHMPKAPWPPVAEKPAPTDET